MEEDYAYKAVIAASYLGFQKQMTEAAEGATTGSPAGRLCDLTLSAIALEPGRIYDKHSFAVTPGEEISKVVGSVTKPGKTREIIEKAEPS